MLFTPYEIEISCKTLEKELKRLREIYDSNIDLKHLFKDPESYRNTQSILKDQINALETTIFKIKTLN